MNHPLPTGSGSPSYAGAVGLVLAIVSYSDILAGIRTSRQMEVSSGSGKVQEIVASYEVQTPDLRAPELGAE